MPANGTIPTAYIPDVRMAYQPISTEVSGVEDYAVSRGEEPKIATRIPSPAKVRESEPEICRRPRYPGRQHAAVQPPTDFFQTLTAS